MMRSGVVAWCFRFPQQWQRCGVEACLVSSCFASPWLPLPCPSAVTCHQDENSRGMVDAKFLAACKPGVRIVNVARGACGWLAWQPGRWLGWWCAEA